MPKYQWNRFADVYAPATATIEFGLVPAFFAIHTPILCVNSVAEFHMTINHTTAISLNLH